MRDRLSALMVVNKGIARHNHLEGLDVVPFIHRHDDGVGLRDGVRNTPSCRLHLTGEHLLTDGIDGLILELFTDLDPTEILPNPCTRRIKGRPVREPRGRLRYDRLEGGRPPWSHR